jgi:hypothetical protein
MPLIEVNLLSSFNFEGYGVYIFSIDRPDLPRTCILARYSMLLRIKRIVQNSFNFRAKDCPFPPKTWFLNGRSEVVLQYRGPRLAGWLEEMLNSVVVDQDAIQEYLADWEVTDAVNSALSNVHLRLGGDSDRWAICRFFQHPNIHDTCTHDKSNCD